MNGETRETSNPLVLDNWDFYVVPTSVINKKSKDNKTISLNRIRSLGYNPISFDKLRQAVDLEIDNIKKEA